MRSSLIAALLVVVVVSPVFALERRAVRENDGVANSAARPGCPLTPSMDGTLGNYRSYNLCSGYIWIYSGFQPGEGVGVRFGGPNQPLGQRGCIGGGIKRGIYYFRNTVPGYGQYVDLYLDTDDNDDGCPDGVLSSVLNVDPAERWNCVNYGGGVGGAAESVILRQVRVGSIAPSFATDGPYSATCDPVGREARSFFYGANGSSCVPWQGPTSRVDNIIALLIVDGYPLAANSLVACCRSSGCTMVDLNTCVCIGGIPIPGGTCSSPGICATSTEGRSWGSIKAIYR